MVALRSVTPVRVAVIGAEQINRDVLAEISGGHRREETPPRSPPWAAPRCTPANVAGNPVDVICCHVKSKLLTFPGDRFSTSNEDERARCSVYALGRRAAEAATVRGIATQLLDGQGQHRALVVLGDLNDTEHSATTTLINGPGGSEIGTAGFACPDQGDATRLWNLATAIPAERRFSRTYRGRRELIDHIMISHALLAGLGDVVGLRLTS